MATYTAVAEEVDAFQWDGTTDTGAWPSWATTYLADNQETIRFRNDPDGLKIIVRDRWSGDANTEYVARKGDWLVYHGDAKGQVYVLAPAVFAASYTAV